jgi:hypothetical protein
MTDRSGLRLFGVLSLALVGVLGTIAAPAQAAPSDPLFVFTPQGAVPPPNGRLNGPCGLAVDSHGVFYVSDYYHDAVDAFTGARGYLTQLAEADPLDGPCAAAVDSTGRLYVEDRHRAVLRYAPEAFPLASNTKYGAATTIDEAHVTGVAVDPSTDDVYIDERTQVAVYDPSGAPVEVAGQPLRIGVGSIGDGYGVAVSGFPGNVGEGIPSTEGFVYVPDASDDTIKVYDPASSTEIPVGEITGAGGTAFVSLRDSAVAVDNATGEVYVLDNLQPEHAEQPRGVVQVFRPPITPKGPYTWEGHLKYEVVDGAPSGLAVDNSSAATQGRVYVTSGNTHEAAVYAYERGAATKAAPLPPAAPLAPLGGTLLQPRLPIGGAAPPGSGIACEGDSCQVLPPEPVDPTLTTRLEGLGNPKVRYRHYRHRRCRQARSAKRHCRHAKRAAHASAGAGQGLAAGAGLLDGGGGGAATAVASAVSASAPTPIDAGFDASVLDATGQPASVAGSHPYELELALGLDQSGGQADLREAQIGLPPGLLVDPAAVNPLCQPTAFATPRSSPFEASQSGESCPDRTQVGTVEVQTGGGQLRRFGLFELQAADGAALRLGASPYGQPLLFDARIDQDGGAAHLSLAAAVPQALALHGLRLTLWGAPWDASHNAERGNCLDEAEPSFPWCMASVGEPLTNPPLAFLTLPTECGSALSFTARGVSWQGTGALSATAVNHDPGGEPVPVSGCDSLGFGPSSEGFLSVKKAASATGFVFRFTDEDSDLANPRARIDSLARRAVVQLPRGVTINPSVGAGLGACTPAQLAAESAFNPPGAGCPNGSKIGSFSIRSPFYENRLSGGIYLATPHDNPFGSLIAVYLVAKSAQRGILITAAGKLTPDPADGTLTAVFDDLPQLPYSELEVNFRSGQRAPLVSPPVCGPASTRIELAPWSGGAGVLATSDSPIETGIDTGPCPAGTPPFSPSAIAGGVNANVNSYTPYFVHLVRHDNEQEITSYSLVLPEGITGKLAGIPFCPDAAIAAARANGGFAEAAHPSCPAASQVGRTETGYGVGPALTYAPGRIYLAGPYHGSPLSLVTINSATVGPFDLGTVVIRSAFDVDPRTAQLRIDSHASDPIPHIIDGIPLHLRDVRVYMDRHEFTHNPSSCEASRLVSTLTGSGANFADPGDDSSAQIEERFQLLNCLTLGFRPKLGLRLRGQIRRGGFPALRATFAARGARDSNLKRIEVDMPHQLFLAQNHIRTVCTRVQFAAERCPSGSVYGRAVAYTPLLDQPLRGDVYLRSSDNKLPDLVTSLRSGEIRIDLVGRIGPSKEGGIQAFFDNLPDAPIKRFTMLLRGGRYGLLTNSVNVCKRPPRASVKALAQNNVGAIFTSELRGKCPAAALGP